MRGKGENMKPTENKYQTDILKPKCNYITCERNN